MRRRPLHAFKVEPRRQRGAVVILLTVAMVALLAMAGLALDGGHLMLNKTRLQNAVDAAALSGAKTLSLMKGEALGTIESKSRDAALNTLLLNAKSTEGNGELASAIGGASLEDAASFAKVEFSKSVYGAFSEILSNQDDARYIRVTVSNYRLAGFFWGFLDSLGEGDLGIKRVAAVAVAGPSPTRPCDLMPIMVCGDPTPESGTFWGYRFGQLQVLKMAAGQQNAGQSDEEWDVGTGNFHLLRLGQGAVGQNIEDGMAGGIDQCSSPDKLYVGTQPGGMIGKVRSGYNTRFGEGSTAEYPSDYIIDNADSSGLLELADDGSVVDKYKNVVTASTESGEEGWLVKNAARLDYDYPSYHSDTVACIDGAGCSSDASPWRRVLKIVIGDCKESASGATPVKVLGYGCFFALQKLDNGGGNKANIFGQFIDACDADGYPSENPSEDAGPHIIQLYKSHIGTGAGVPSGDS